MEKKQIVGFTCGAFDVLHAGHCLMLKEAKEHCDYLVVFLDMDPSITPPGYRGKQKNKPIQTAEERTVQLQSNKYVDEIIPYLGEEDLYNKIKNDKRLNRRIIGADWKGKNFTGYDLPIEVYYNTRDHTFSSTDLRNRIYEFEMKKREEK